MGQICSCNTDRFLLSMLQRIEDRVYNRESDTFIYDMLQAINQEICEAYGELIKAKNDMYLWVDVENEEVVKGNPDTLDVLQYKSVVEILSIGNTPGASDYIENVDYVVTECGPLWKISDMYYGSYYAFSANYGYGFGMYGTSYGYNYGYGFYPYYNPWYPYGRKEPETGATYYVNYRYGCRNENLYNNFGRSVKLSKKDIWEYPEYRKAIKALIAAFLSGPNLENIKDALSIFHPREHIEILEIKNVGWILGESILYTEDDYNDTAVDTTDGCILKNEGEGKNEFVVIFHFASTLSSREREVVDEVLDIIKPAHTTASTQYLTGV